MTPLMRRMQLEFHLRVQYLSRHLKATGLPPAESRTELPKPRSTWRASVYERPQYRPVLRARKSRWEPEQLTARWERAVRVIEDRQE